LQLIKWKAKNDFNLFLFGDDHEGNVLRHQHGWDQLVDMMNYPYDGCAINYGVDHGDFCDAITVDDPRYDGLTVKGTPLQQLHNAVRHRDRIKQFLVTILEGNHPLKLWKFGALTADLCKELNVQYGTYSAKITYVNGRGDVLFKHHATHGRRSVNSTADDPIRQLSNMKLQLKRHLKKKFADCVLHSKGHTHKLLCCKPISDLYMTDNGKIVEQNFTRADHNAEYIPPDLRWYVNTGSFLRSIGIGFSGYAEIAEYDPIELGFYIARVREKKIVSIDKIRVD